MMCRAVLCRAVLIGGQRGCATGDVVHTGFLLGPCGRHYINARVLILVGLFERLQICNRLGFTRSAPR